MVDLKFIVPGFSKCGTTTLCSLINQHTDIFIPEEKEPWYFSSPRFAEKHQEYIATSKPLQLRNGLLQNYLTWDYPTTEEPQGLPGFEAAIALLEDRNQEEDRRLLVAAYTEIGDYAMANQWLAQVTGGDAETIDFKNYYRDFHQNECLIN